MIRLRVKRRGGTETKFLVDVATGKTVGEVRRAKMNPGLWTLHLDGVYWPDGLPVTTGGPTGIRCDSYADALLLAGAAAQILECPGRVN